MLMQLLPLQALDELYHKDKGYNRNRVVVLCDEEPDPGVRHVLYTHDSSNNVVYLRGSPFQARVSLPFSHLIISALQYPGSELALEPPEFQQECLAGAIRRLTAQHAHRPCMAARSRAECFYARQCCDSCTAHDIAPIACCLQDLARAAVVYADAVIIIAPKYSDDTTSADRCTAMMALAMGQYLQDAHALMNQQLKHTPHRLWHWLQHGRVSWCFG